MAQLMFRGGPWDGESIQVTGVIGFGRMEIGWIERRGAKSQRVLYRFKDGVMVHIPNVPMMRTESTPGVAPEYPKLTGNPLIDGSNPRKG